MVKITSNFYYSLFFKSSIKHQQLSLSETTSHQIIVLKILKNDGFVGPMLIFVLKWQFFLGVGCSDRFAYDWICFLLRRRGDYRGH